MFFKSQFAHLCNDINTSLPVLKVAWRRNGSLMSSVQHLRKGSDISQGHVWFKPAFPRTAAFELEELSSVTAVERALEGQSRWRAHGDTPWG